ncbi:MAG: YraN family protein [Gammaproteobacteria bacterium]|nr:MAG: YraN family protein [Gammaproteobacteria bacterium]
MKPAGGKDAGDTGAWAESLARRYLKDRGLVLLRTNYRGRRGEIDLIMEHQDTLVFVEVRYRKTAGHGCSAESVDVRKRTRLINTAQHFLCAHHRELGNRPCRFDVIAIDGPKTRFSVQWIQHAFEA